MVFDVSLISSISDQIGQAAQRLKQNANSPNELIAEIQKIESNINSLKSLAQGTNQAGMNANSVQNTPNQNLS